MVSLLHSPKRRAQLLACCMGKESPHRKSTEFWGEDDYGNEWRVSLKFTKHSGESECPLPRKRGMSRDFTRMGVHVTMFDLPNIID